MNLQQQGTEEKLTKLNNIRIGDIFSYAIEDGAERLFMRIAVAIPPQDWQYIDCVALDTGSHYAFDLNITVTEVEHVLHWNKK